MRTIIFGVALLVGVARASCAEPATDPFSTQFLRETCQQEGTPQSQHFCLGFLEGAGQVMTVNGYQHHQPFAICPPNNQIPTGTELIQSFITWADKHPEHWSEEALPSAAHAFQETWPCQESK